MKKLFLVFIFFFSYNAFSQVIVQGVNINELDIKYCEIIGYNKSLFGKKIIISIDYGQKFSPFKSQTISGPDNKPMIFNSMIDALNFMEKNGWAYVNNYAVSSTNGSIYHYLFKKKNESE